MDGGHNQLLGLEVALRILGLSQPCVDPGSISYWHPKYPMKGRNAEALRPLAGVFGEN